MNIVCYLSKYGHMENNLLFLCRTITFFGQTQAPQIYPLLLLLHFHSIIRCRIYIALINWLNCYLSAHRHFGSWGSHLFSRASLWGIFSFPKTYPLFVSCLNGAHFLLSFGLSHIQYSSHNMSFSNFTINPNLYYYQLINQKEDGYRGFTWKRRDAL